MSTVVILASIGSGEKREDKAGSRTIQQAAGGAGLDDRLSG
jgi:hypothetical protein